MHCPVFHFKEKAGNYPVGVKVVEQYDYSRAYRYSTDDLGKPFRGERARPLQTLVWFPAEHNRANKPMTVGDYVSLLETETTFAKPKTSSFSRELLSAMSPTLATSLWAVRDAQPSSGRFPVVIYAPSFSNVSWENADLCEYLASHGYVVVASPCMGQTTRNMTQDLPGINAQARDVSFLVGYACTLSNTDMSQVAVIGFSWGGISNLFAAARDNRIGALVALDGSLRCYPGLVKRAGDVHPEQMTIPLLSFAQRYWSLEASDRLLTGAERDGPSVLNAWTHGDLINIHMLGLSHAEHSSMYQRNEDAWSMLFHEWRMFKGDYDREDGIIGYAWMARYTLRFLDAYLKRDATALAFLKATPAENGAPRHVMAVTYRSAEGVPISFEGFRSEIGRRGFEHITEIYAAMLKTKPDFKLDEGSVIAWADELINHDLLSEATSLLVLNVEMYPNSSGAHASLGDAYQRAGQKQLAIESYERSLDRDPMNPMNLDTNKKLAKLEDDASRTRKVRQFF